MNDCIDGLVFNKDGDGDGICGDYGDNWMMMMMRYVARAHDQISHLVTSTRAGSSQI